MSNSNFTTKFICPKESYLATLESFPTHTLPCGKWIMQRHQTRSHMRFDFDVTKSVSSIQCELLCDAPFDLYINGKAVDTFKEGDGLESYHKTGLCDITSLCTNGQNKVGICIYGSDTPEKFCYAMRGCIRVNYADATHEDFVTCKKHWHTYLVCGFGKATQPENWYISDNPGRMTELDEFDTHPRLRRRSVVMAKEFEVDENVKSATLKASARGLYVPFINDVRATDARFLPGVGDNATEYRTFDVTELVKTGKNTISATLGNGWLNCGSWGYFFETEIPSLAVRLEIQYDDGTVKTVCTDESWTLLPSPLLDNDIQKGERYDARLEVSAQDVVEKGVKAVVVDSSKFPKIQEQVYPSVKAHTTLTALSMFKLPDGKHMCYDFGTNATGRAKITLRNTKPGQYVFIRYCELLHEDNTPNFGSFTDVYFPLDCEPGQISEYAARNLDLYICKGAEVEEYTPEFAYTGFRYIYITGLNDGEYTLDTVKKLEINTDLCKVGEFETSNADMAKIWDAVKRSYRSNIFNGPMDCPTREKNFWNGDIQIFANTACWYMDNSEFLGAWTRVGRKMQPDVYGWEDEDYILPLILYKYYGDVCVIEDKYPVVQRLIEKRLSQLEHGETLPKDHSPYCDHQAVVNVPPEFFAACYFILMYKNAADMANILGKYYDEKAYRARFNELRAEFNDKFYLADEHDYTPRCQGAVILPCVFGIADSENIPTLADKLHEYVVQSGYHLTSGFMSTEHILGFLCEYGYSDDAWKIISNKEAPSMLHMLSTHGGGTTTESWKGAGAAGASMNHYAIGCMARYFFEQAGGLTVTSPGFDSISLKPYFNKELGDCKVTFDCRHGQIVSEWKYNKDINTFTWKIKVPSCVKAGIILPEHFEFVKTGVCTENCTSFEVKSKNNKF